MPEFSTIATGVFIVIALIGVAGFLRGGLMGLMSLFKMLWSFSGRWGRRSFFKRSFYHPILVCLLVFVPISLPGSKEVDINKLILNVAGVLVFLVQVPILVRRYHDFGKSAWWVVGALSTCALFLGISAFLIGQSVQPYFAYLGLAIFFFLYLAAVTIKGDVGQNKYGLSPKPSLPS